MGHFYTIRSHLSINNGRFFLDTSWHFVILYFGIMGAPKTGWDNLHGSTVSSVLSLSIWSRVSGFLSLKICGGYFWVAQQPSSGPARLKKLLSFFSGGLSTRHWPGPLISSGPFTINFRCLHPTDRSKLTTFVWNIRQGVHPLFHVPLFFLTHHGISSYCIFAWTPNGHQRNIYWFQ